MNAIAILGQNIRLKDKLFSLNDLHKASGSLPKHQPNRFLRLDTTKDLINEMTSYPDMGSTHEVQNGKGTWVCKELVYAYAMWISAKFHLLVIRAFDAMVNDESNQSSRQSTATQLTPLRQKVEQLITTGVGNIYGDIWKLVHNKFEVKTISQLRPDQIVEAVQYLDAIEGEYIAKSSIPEQSKYFYPKSYADPHSREFENALLTPAVLLDDRNRAIELDLLDDLERDGYEITGVRLRILALRQAAKQHMQIQRDLNSLRYFISEMSKAIDNGSKTYGLNVDFSGSHRKRIN
ncbi:KilA-N domain-containing protein [Vibrio cholerae]|uniref:KilA-N domain-containing protein n=1 Tax=Vibrio cholerae TaxID=666 RepID=UPI0013B70EE6|nr:KilA-N domain-containing protein [Vibrio cholerae]MVB41244.1 KilA-N domain-containing protein [Vibrio cholerae]